MTKYNVLVIGSGGREHALAWALSRSARVEQVFVAPGNAGTEWPARPKAQGLQPRAAAHNVPIRADDFAALVMFARDNDVSLTVVGPETPLAAGIVDHFQAAGLAIFGPCGAAARLEASKAFAKNFMRDHHIATADYGIFTDYAQARDFIHSRSRPLVVKADGLAAGKGVLICDNAAEAEAALRTIMQERAFGAAGDAVVIEDKLNGREISLLAFTDGKTIVPMPPARDHKRALDGDQGLNTGGMGAFAPTTDIPPALVDQIVQTVMQPVVDGMAAQGTPYVGVLYAGLMLTPDGPQVLEFNCRLGDPEAQAVLPLLETDLYDILSACVAGRLSETPICWRDQSCATIVVASPGYPAACPQGLPISGLDALAQRQDVVVFHAGTACREGQIVTAGGRVLAVTAPGSSLSQALERAYDAVGQIHFEGMQYRRDIGRTAPGGVT